jgi:hypothetical protein
MLDELLYCLPEARSTPEQCAYSDQVMKASQLYLDVASLGKTRFNIAAHDDKEKEIINI